jgi:hypothetical protein
MNNGNTRKVKVKEADLIQQNSYTISTTQEKCSGVDMT